jgi:membrane protein DedA with SNARE-associated domain
MKVGVLITAALLAGGLVVASRRRRPSRPLLVLAGLLIAGLVVSGTGVIHLPSAQVMIRDGARALGPFTYVLVGALAYLETAGDVTSYALGRRLGREFLTRHGAAVGVSEQRLTHVERFFADHGGKTIVVGRFIGLVRVLSPFIAGASRMPARHFAAYTTIASGLWAATFSLLGYAFWQSLDELLALTKQGTLTLAAIGAVIVGAVALHRRRRRPRSAPTG